MPATAAPVRHRAFDFAMGVAGRMHRAGVRILAGTDTGIPYIVQGFSLHRELQWLVKAGLTPLEALQAATIRPAEYFGITDSAGTITKGKFADLVLLNADPLKDIDNAGKIEAVVAGGHYLSRGDLDGMLEKLKTAGAGGAKQENNLGK
jgi:imidazolonepropionase-like amidohydrolase